MERRERRMPGETRRDVLPPPLLLLLETSSRTHAGSRRHTSCRRKEGGSREERRGSRRTQEEARSARGSKDAQEMQCERHVSSQETECAHQTPQSQSRGMRIVSAMKQADGVEAASSLPPSFARAALDVLN